MTTIRAPKWSDRLSFSMPRATAQHGKRAADGLSFEARGVLVYLLSKPDDWEILIPDLMAEGGIGRDKARKLLAELRAAGYIKTEMAHDEGGKFEGKVDRIHEIANPDKSNRDTENPYNGKPVIRKNRRTVNPQLHNIDSIQNTEKDIVAANAGDVANAEAPSMAARQTYAEQHPEMSEAEMEAQAAELSKRNPAQKKARPANPYFDAIVAAFGDVPEKLTKSESGLIGKAASELKAAGYQPEDIAKIHAYCVRAGYSNFTALALAKHAGAWRKTQQATPSASPSGLHIFQVVED